MKYWLITDTHFWHVDKMWIYCNRPKDYCSRIIKWLAQIQEGDILIHLWDICIWNDKKFCNIFKKQKFKTYLIRWNHDKKTNTFYNKYFDFVWSSMWLYHNWLKILFSHKPIMEWTYDYNIHWHCHNCNSREDNITTYWEKYYNWQYHLLALEIDWYWPITLNNFIRKNKLHVISWGNIR